MRTLPQHLTQGASEINTNSFPMTGASPAINIFASIHQPLSGSTNQGEKPTAAQAAAGRLQRASARQAAKAAQQQKRHAQARAAAKKGALASVKRKKDEATQDDDGETDEDCSADAGVNERGDDTQAKPHEIAKSKYNHVEDEKERKRLKRLLRNRVSAQQARERKKAYMSTLEDERRAMEAKTSELEARINTLERENFMLRQVVKNSTKAGTEKMGLVFATDEPRVVPSQ